jgi:hypothetical protein
MTRPSTPTTPRLTVLGLLATLTLIVAANAARAAPSSLRLRRQILVGHARTIVLRNRVGRVLVQGEPKTTTVDARVTIRPNCQKHFSFFELFHLFWSDSCHALPAHTVIALERAQGRLRLSLLDARGNELKHVRSDWILTVPENMTVSLKEGVGRVDLTDLHGDLRLNVGVGTVTIAGSGGPRTSVHDGVGTIVLKSFTLPPKGRLALHSGVGAIRLQLKALPPSQPGDISLHTGVGAVTVSGLPCRLAHVTARTGVGAIVTNHPLRGLAVTRRIASSSLKGGNGNGLTLRIHTGTGTIHLAWNKTHCP